MEKKIFLLVNVIKFVRFHYEKLCNIILLIKNQILKLRYDFNINGKVNLY